jgi:outer membrane murein-binding lipoprotein Lpp
MRRRLIAVTVIVAVFLVAVPVFAATGVTDPVMEKLEAIMTQMTALNARLNALESKTEALHKAVVGDDHTPAAAFVIKSSGTKPISSAVNDDGFKAELVELKEQGTSVVAKIRLTTGEKARTYDYVASLETGRQRIKADVNFEDVPAGTTRELVLTYKGAAGQLTQQGYFSIQYYYDYRWHEPIRLPLVAQP